ncbi:hypothetical protein T440DRAFT_491028 [Plenodomus tracheiphilus IPT5]|uniref:AB hydrolase-1 domain-containing protein n=1 Tax=Plenodomus tracheiphilus IPT5 TaxID=1408161 RepID=A0A6A7AZC1_9PLEO|nr:hypothetical protein T440DRAFT_491028 [Plenodomus tracheiphilus IPT5]
MTSFKLALANNGVVTGMCSMPDTITTEPGSRPLVVAIHGGCYDHRYFDATPETSALLTSNALGVPFVAIDRPSYGGTTSLLPLSKDENFIEQTGLWLHQYILPTIWSEFGEPNKCDCIVLLSHSMGVMGATIAASLHARDNKPLYPLGGLIASGMGDKTIPQPPANYPLFNTYSYFLPPEAKDKAMFKPGTVSTSVLEQTERLNGPTPILEVSGCFTDTWLPNWKQKWAPHVVVPVMFALVDDDPYFIVNEDELSTCTKAFVTSSCVDGSLVRGAPHCIELSHWSRGWYARCFGFALECSTGFLHSRSSTEIIV